MGILAICKCLWLTRINTKPLSPALMGYLHVDGCPLVANNIEIFMDDFSGFGQSFDVCLKKINVVFKRCRETRLVLNWEKCQFMVRECIV